MRELLAALPPPVVKGTGSKTHGRWLDEDGTAHAISSGQDAAADDTRRLLETRGMPAASAAAVATTSHVELKLAAEQVRDGRCHVDVVVNNEPCQGVFGCERLLPILLPAGYSLTVHSPNYRRTFTGGAKPWWR